MKIMLLVLMVFFSISCSENPAEKSVRQSKEVDTIHDYLAGKPVARSDAFWLGDDRTAGIKLDNLEREKLITSEERKNLMGTRFNYEILFPYRIDDTH